MMTLNELFQEKKMPLIVSVPENNADLARAALKGGADALKFHINVNHRASGNEFKSLNHYLDVFQEIREMFNGPMGIVLSDDVNKITMKDVSKLKEIGFTYFSLYASEITTELLQQNDLERTVALNDAYNAPDVKLINDFGMGAVELSIIKKEDYGSLLNFEDILQYASFRNQTNLPLIIPTQKRIVPEDIQMLHEIGMNAVMLGAVTIGKTEESILKSVSEFYNISSKL